MATAVATPLASPTTKEMEMSPEAGPSQASDHDEKTIHPKVERNSLPPPPLPLPLPTLHDEAQPTESVQHSRPSDPSTATQGRSRTTASSSKSPRRQESSSKTLLWVEGPVDGTEPDLSTQNDSYTRAAEFNPSHTMTVAHTRRNANGTIGSVYSGNKIRHLKKDDGVPLWRKDIQLKFLRCVFEDKTAVFTSAFDGTTGHTFADIYVDAMARSSKTSKVLKDKLLADKEGAMTMAMICLLVNVGRMNTTLNFFPEMRAQLRTYHAIPSLQANADPSAYKQLQDAPRLKSILKGASEDSSQPNSIDKIKQAKIPRTNPVNLIFVLSQYAPKISEIHFHPPRDFFDLVMRATLSSKSRAKAFLWLVWWYLESDFSKHDALNNPFGAGQHGDEGGGMPIKVPSFEHLTEEQADAENVDTENEVTWGEMKKEERKRILEDDETVGPPMKKSKRVNGESQVPISDTDPTRSPSPSPATQGRANLSTPHGDPTANGFGPESSPTTATAPFPAPRSSNPRYPPLQSKASSHRLALKTTLNSANSPQPNTSSPSFPHHSASNAHAPTSTTTSTSRRPRPETSHQKAVSRNRRMRTDHILHKQMLTAQKHARREKRRTASSAGMLAYERILDVGDTYETEDESRSWGPGGLVPNPGVDEEEDYGDEAIRRRKVVERALRRLDRASSGGRKINGGGGGGVGAVGSGGGSLTSYPWFGQRRKRKEREVEKEEEEEEEEEDRRRRPRLKMQKRGGRAKRVRVSSGVGGRARKSNGVGGAGKGSAAAASAANGSGSGGGGGGGAGRTKQEGLDDLDLDLLGEGRSDEDEDEVEVEAEAEAEAENGEPEGESEGSGGEGRGEGEAEGDETEDEA